MAEAKTRLYEVPEELYDPAWITDYLCEHLRKKVLAGVRIEAKEIGSIGPLKIDDDEDIQATLGSDACQGYLIWSWSEGGSVSFDVSTSDPTAGVIRQPALTSPEAVYLAVSAQ